MAFVGAVPVAAVFLSRTGMLLARFVSVKEQSVFVDPQDKQMEFA